MDGYAPPGAINFGDIPEAIDAMLQEGVRAYRSDRARADRLFREALHAAPAQLAVYFCLYKIHTYQGHLDEARAIAQAGLAEAARQAGWPENWQQWRPVSPLPDDAGRSALYTLKALAFIDLRQGKPERARTRLDALRIHDPAGGVGWPVVEALAEGIG